MACTCKTSIEAELTERFKKQKPDGSGHKVKLEGYGFSIVNNTMVMKPFMPYKASAGFPTRSGVDKEKSLKGSMIFSFCPFCGKKLPAGAA